MKKWSMGVALAMTLVFLVTAVMPAFAITGEEQAQTLKDLGIIEGYEDGELRLEQTITRAEMCVVLSKMAGMQDAAQLLEDDLSDFSDVKVSVWYTGYINLASQNNWVSGYPDGTFKPNNNVTNAEALAMILNVLGFGDGELPGSWPTNYMVKAEELGILGDLTVVAGEAALRGWVFSYAHAALDVELVNWSEDQQSFIGQDETLMDGLAVSSSGTVAIVDAYLMVGSALDDEDRTVQYKNYDFFSVAALQEVAVLPFVSGYYDVDDGFDIRPYVGIPTDFYLNADDEIIAVKETGEVMVASLVKATGAGYFYLDNDDEDEFRGHSIGIGIVNEQLIDWGLDHVTGGTLRYVLDDEDMIIFAELVDFDPDDENYVDGDGLVDDVDIDGDEVSIAFKNENNDLDLDLDDNILVFGAASSVQGIQEYDVLTWNEEGSDIALYVTRDMVEGIADRYSSTYISVGDVNYDFAYEVSASYDDGETFAVKDDSFDAIDLSEEEATLYLNGVGEIYAAVTDAGSDIGVAFVTDELESDEEYGITTYRVELLFLNGQYATAYFEEDLVPGSGNYDGTFVEYSLNNDGEIDFFQAYVGDSSDDISYLDEEDTRDYERLVADDSDKYYAVNESVFVMADPDEDGSYDDAQLISWTSIQSIGDASDVLGEVFADSQGDITYCVFYEPIVGEAGDYSVYLDKWFVGDDDYVSFINEAGIQEQKYSEDRLCDFTQDTVVKIKASGTTVYFEDFPGPFVEAVIPEDAYNSSRNALTILADGEFEEIYDLDLDTVVVDLTGDNPIVISVSALEEDDLVVVYYDGLDEVLDFIVVLDGYPVLSGG
jgi:hypothetical protein